MLTYLGGEEKVVFKRDITATGFDADEKFVTDYPGIVRDLKISPDSTSLLICGDHPTPTIFEFEEKKTVGTKKSHQIGTLGGVWTHDSKHFATFDETSQILIFSKNGEYLKSFSGGFKDKYRGSPGDFDSMNTLYYPNGRSVNKILDFTKIQNLDFLKEEKDVRAVKLFGDSIIVTLSGMKTVSIWDLVEERRLFSAEAKTDIHDFTPFIRDGTLTVYFTDSEGNFGYFTESDITTQILDKIEKAADIKKGLI